MKKILFTITCVCLLLASCNEPTDVKKSSESKIEREPKEAIYMDIQVKHSTNTDLLYVTKIVHNEIGSEVKRIVTVDTIPKMGLTTDTLATNKVVTNSEGNEVPVDTIIVHPRNYQLFISVKN